MFLYRFLQENLTYISTMLAMRLPPLEAAAALALPPTEPATVPLPAGQADAQQGGGANSGSGSAAAAAGQAAIPAGQDAQQQALQPFVLLMDVQASAPNICLPRHSSGCSCPALAVPAMPCCILLLARVEHEARPCHVLPRTTHAHSLPSPLVRFSCAPLRVSQLTLPLLSTCSACRQPRLHRC